MDERKEPTQQEIEQFWKEVEQDEAGINYTKIHCKPTYNFQSIEFDYDITSYNDIKKAMALYKLFVDELMAVAPEQPAKQVEKVAVKPKAEMPTEKMYTIMDRFGIPYTSKTTKVEAQKLIADNINKN